MTIVVQRLLVGSFFFFLSVQPRVSPGKSCFQGLLCLPAKCDSFLGLRFCASATASTATVCPLELSLLHLYQFSADAEGIGAGETSNPSAVSTSGKLRSLFGAAARELHR